MPDLSTTGAADLVAALDIGGTKTTAALVTAGGEVVGRHTAPTPGRSGAAAVLDTAAGLVEKLRADAPGAVRADNDLLTCTPAPANLPCAAHDRSSAPDS
ncbi:hypothetical protein AB0F93_29285, partial [Micromonospora tulbaghiae]